MTEYYIPTDYGIAEYVEKRSRFIGQVWHISTEEEARSLIEQTKKKYHDARHNCWCFILRDGTMRYSDDGEPQGTAGQPMLEVFSRAGMTDVVCVVTRYFGGILLGTGGLVRAYTKASQDAMTAAGTSVERLWDRLLVPCSYSMFERVRNETLAIGGAVEDTDYGTDVMLTVLTPEEKTADYISRLTELSNGRIECEQVEKIFRAFPVSRV